MKRVRVLIREVVTHEVDVLVDNIDAADDFAVEVLLSCGSDCVSVEDRQVIDSYEVPPKQAVTAKELSNLRMAAGNEHKYDRVVLDGKVKAWVGIGWVEERGALPSDYDNLPVVEN